MEKKLLNHYRKDAKGNYLLEIKVSRIADLFSLHDPSPLHNRDLNAKIADVIQTQLKIFPDNVPIKLMVYIPYKIKNKLGSRKVINAIKHHFEYDYIDACLHLKRRIQKAKKTFFLAGSFFVVLMSTSLLMHRFLPENIVTNILAEGLFVGAWVSMWHPLETLLYEWIPLFEDKKKFSKIIAMDIGIKYY